MKKIFLSFFTVFAFSVALQAQNKNVAKPAPTDAMEKIKKLQSDNIDLALKDIGVIADQAVLFKSLYLKYEGQYAEVVKNPSIDDIKREQKMEEIVIEKDNKLTEIIGADKYSAFNKIRREQKNAEAELMPNKG